MAYREIFDALCADRQLALMLALYMDTGDTLACGECPMCSEGPKKGEYVCNADFGDGCVREVDPSDEACPTLYDAVDDADAHYAALDTLELGDMAYEASREALWDR